MPSDYLTPKQRKELSGKVMSYNFNERIIWETFRSWPLDIQQEYLDWFCDKWGLGQTYLAKAFNISKSTLNLYLKEKKLDCKVKSKGGASTNMTDRMLFEEWLKSAQGEAPLIEMPIEQPKTPGLTMRSGSLEYEGNIAAILEAVYKIIGEGSGIVRIEWSVAS